MNAKEVLVRAIDCIEASGFVSKSEALYSGKRSTADIISASFEVTPVVSQDEIGKHGKTAEDILDWLSAAPADDYIANCKLAVAGVEEDTSRWLGLLCSLPSAYKKHLDTSAGMHKVTNPNAFSADPGTRFIGTCEVVNVRKFDTYTKVCMVDIATGCMVAFTESVTDKKKLTGKMISAKLSVGDKVKVSASVYRNKFTTPFETTLSRPIIEKI